MANTNLECLVGAYGYLMCKRAVFTVLPTSFSYAK